MDALRDADRLHARIAARRAARDEAARDEAARARARRGEIPIDVYLTRFKGMRPEHVERLKSDFMKEIFGSGDVAAARPKT